MIRQGFVHDSPGYVCPFCPDREHNYPRPDNLARYAILPCQESSYMASNTCYNHVRVHHVDKDKDDPLLREVLAQHLDTPNHRRQRGLFH